MSIRVVQGSDTLLGKNDEPASGDAYSVIDFDPVELQLIF